MEMINFANIMRWVHTTDIHGMEMLQNLKQQLGADVLSDGGDCLQGSSWTAFASSGMIAEEMNQMGYDVGVAGNHDIAAGKECLELWARNCKFPLLGMNGRYYTVIEKEGMKIGVAGFMFADLQEQVHEAVKKLLETEKVDLLVGLFHSGWEGGMMNENITRKVAEETVGFDLILYGHDHHTAVHRVQNKHGKEVLCVGGGCFGMATIINCQQHKENGWTFDVEFRYAGMEHETRAEHFPKYKEWLNTPIATLTDKIEECDSFFGPSAFITLFHKMQFWATGADISFASPVNYDSAVSAGMQRMKDMFTLYRFDTQLFIMQLSGKEIRNVLERSYGRWANEMRQASDDALLMGFILDGGTRKGLINSSLNMLSAEGINYTVDITQPSGKKVAILQMSDGRAFDENSTYTVAVNSHHGTGWGGLFPNVDLAERIIKTHALSTRECLTEYLRQQSIYVPETHSNWKFVPTAWADEALKRDRAILFGKE